MKSEKGQALPMVLIAMCVGALVVSPFLNHAGSSLIGSRNYAQAIYSQYACDSGAEHAIWNLTNGGLTDNLSSPGDSVSYSLGESINSLGTNITVSNEWETIARDDFESGDWAGGSGWLDDWYSEGEAIVTIFGTPYEGSYHLRLRSSTGYVERSVDLSNEVSARLQFWAKADAFEGGETASCLVSENGTDWTTVYTWINGDDDNQYHFYDIDLSAFNMSSEFWIAFDANMSSTWDYFYVDDLKIVCTYGTYAIVASDDFESGDWTGGSGWLDDWYSEGEAIVTPSGPPYEGSYHLRLRNSTGYVKRSVDLSNEVSARLQFWAQASSFESGETVSCLVSENGTDWTTVYTWINGDGDNQYHFYDIDLSAFNMSSEFWIAFDANMGDTGSYFYVDAIDVKGTAVYLITSEAGYNMAKVVVRIEDGNVTVLAWYIK